MRVLIFGGAGFVGLNIAQHLSAAGCDVVLCDRAEPAAAQRAAFGDAANRITFLPGDVTRPETVIAAVTPGLDTIIYGAAITADATRDAAEPERILAVNLAGLVPVLRAARAAGVRRVINLSSATAVGRIGDNVTMIDEALPPDPASLYALTKMASERLCERLAELWQMDIVSVRLSSVFGPFEYATGVRDTLSPIGQIMMAASRSQAAVLPRPGYRDWVYARDVAAAVARVIEAPSLTHRLYNITSGTRWPALAWGQGLGRLRPGFACRLAEGGEPPTIDLFAPSDRPPLSPARLASELGWTAHYGLEASLADFEAWARAWGGAFWGDHNRRG